MLESLANVIKFVFSSISLIVLHLTKQITLKPGDFHLFVTLIYYIFLPYHHFTNSHVLVLAKL